MYTAASKLSFESRITAGLFLREGKITPKSKLFSYIGYHSPRENCCQMQIQSITAVTKTATDISNREHKSS